MTAEQKAKRIIEDHGNFVIGGYENAIEDGVEGDLPPFDKLVEEIYYGVMNPDSSGYIDGCETRIKDEIRFLGKDKVRNIIETFVTEYKPSWLSRIQEKLHERTLDLVLSESKRNLSEMTTLANKGEGLGNILRVYGSGSESGNKDEHGPAHIEVEGYDGKMVTRILIPLKQPEHVSDVDKYMKGDRSLDRKDLKAIVWWFGKDYAPGITNWLFSVKQWNAENYGRYELREVSSGEYENWVNLNGTWKKFGE